MIARKKREWYPGAIYHIMGRGNRRQNIYEDKTDYQYFLALLSDIQKKMPFELHSYCLMTNHFHLLLETKDKEIWHIMKRLMQLYTEYYNNKYGRTGHLFQGRYRSCLVKDDAYFLQTSRYIHLNPVKAKMVLHPEDYLWSSYQTLIGMNHASIVTTSRTLAYFKKPQSQAYRAFVEDTSINMYFQESKIQKNIGEEEEDLWLPW